MPIPPGAAVELAEQAARTDLGKRALKGVGVLLGGVGTGIALMGQVLGGDIAQAESQVVTGREILVSVVGQYEKQAEQYRRRIAQLEIELELARGD